MKQPFNHQKPQIDHNGNAYSFITEMCNTYNIKLETYQRRIKVYHWSVEKALTTPVKKMVDNIVMTIMEDGLNLNHLCVNIGVLIERHISIDVLKD